MSPGPEGADDRAALAPYARAWSALMEDVRRGASWSGGERNSCFLNTGGGGFVEVSRLAGLDSDGDGRALAFCDWDRDGDLDVWFRNRTAPRLQLLLNTGDGGGSVSLKLEGRSCNRDAIGAIAEVRVSGAPPIVRSVRAGEMFLSQSSKWLHVGLGGGAVEEVRVFWPGGDEERFSGVEGEGRFLLRQGGGTAVPVGSPGRVQLPPAAPLPAAAGDRFGRRVALPVRATPPAVRYRDRAARAQRLEPGAGARWLLFWDSACGFCEIELQQAGAAMGRLRGAGIELLALSTDTIESAGDAYDLVDRVGFGGEWGFVEPQSLGAVWTWVERWFDRVPAAVVPFSMLLDAEGQAVAFYFGAAGVDAIVADAERLVGIDRATRWHLAPPFAGSWFTQPPDPAFVRGVLRGR